MLNAKKKETGYIHSKLCERSYSSMKHVQRHMNVVITRGMCAALCHYLRLVCYSLSLLEACVRIFHITQMSHCIAILIYMQILINSIRLKYIRLDTII